MCRMFALEYTMKKFKWLKKTSGSQIRVTRYLNNIELSNHIKTLHDNRYTINVIITPAKKFWGYMCISLFVSLSVYPCNRVRSRSFFNGGTCIKFLLHTKITHELERKVHYICLIYISLMEKYRRVLPYTKIADNLRVYYDFGPRPF